MKMRNGNHPRPTHVGRDSAIAAWLRPGGPAPDELPSDNRSWADLLNRARQTGLAGLVMESARRHGVAIPDGPERSLREAAGKVAANQLNLVHELDTILRQCNDARVPIMLLKGAALCHTIYEEPGLRPMSDIDLLVPPDALARAFQVLEAIGCRRGSTPIREDFFPRFHYEIELLTASPSPARLDLHVRPLRPLRISQTMPDGALWEKARTIRVVRGEALIPKPEFMFIQLAAHAAYHGWERLIWLYDIHRWSRRYGDAMDWHEVVERCREWRLSLPVMRTIERTAALFGPICPDGVRDGFASHRIGWADRWTLRQAPRDAASPLSHVLCNVCCTPGWRFRCAYALALLQPGRQHLGEVYPWRHRGWTVCATAWRIIRGVLRAVCTPLRPIARLRRAIVNRQIGVRTATV